MFSSKVKTTIKDLLDEQLSLGARVVERIPYNCKLEDMKGFICMLGKGEELPVVTICLEKPTGGSIISSLVFRDVDHIRNFTTAIFNDTVMYFDDEAADN